MNNRNTSTTLINFIFSNLSLNICSHTCFYIFFIFPLYLGYLFSLFWSLDLIFILATYAEIVSFPPRTVFQNAVFSGCSMVGRGARLYRLIKIIQQYRIDNEKRKRHNQELGEQVFPYLLFRISFFTLYFYMSHIILFQLMRQNSVYSIFNLFF